jgi:histone H3/H4
MSGKGKAVKGTKKKVRDTRPENFYSTVKRIHVQLYGKKGKGKDKVEKTKRLDSLATSAVAGIAVENARKFAKYAHRMAQQSKMVTVMPKHIQAAINMVVHNEKARNVINDTIEQANQKVQAVIENAQKVAKKNKGKSRKEQQKNKPGSIQEGLKNLTGVNLSVSIRKTLRLMRQECSTLRVSVRSAVICAVAVDQIVKNILSAGHAELKKGDTVNGLKPTDAMKKKVTMTLPFMQSRVQDKKEWSSFVSAGIVGGAPPAAEKLFWANKPTDAQKGKAAPSKKGSKKKSTEKQPAEKQTVKEDPVQVGVSSGGEDTESDEDAPTTTAPKKKKTPAKQKTPKRTKIPKKKQDPKTTASVGTRKSPRRR